MNKFDFLVMLYIWQNILSKIDLVGKSIQSSKMDVVTTVILLDNYTKFLQGYRITEYVKKYVFCGKISFTIKC